MEKQIHKKAKKILSVVFSAVFFMYSHLLFAQADMEKKIQTALILADDGEVITLDPGSFSISKSLSLDGKNNIVIRGRGIDKTILSFASQVSGAEGIRITNCSNVILEDLTVQDSKGDLIKAMHVNGITFRRVKAEWTGKPSEKNGGYAIYPVQCENVLIDSCIAIGASDAGIYVGQSKNIVVRNCTAYNNVAGIEIENSIYADVYGNTATGNTGGILVFDLPDLVVKNGGHTRVYNNTIKENNLSNFAPKGNIVAKVPRGTGLLLIAANQVEIFNNDIVNNATMGVGVISYFLTENKIRDKQYNPYSSGIFIHDNFFERKKRRVPLEGRFAQIYWFKLKFGRRVPHIVFDGIVDPSLRNTEGKFNPVDVLCIRNNKNQSFANIDAENDFKQISRDMAVYNCTMPAVQTGVKQ
jgi:parallel beta-helix repeat protein